MTDDIDVYIPEMVHSLELKLLTLGGRIKIEADALKLRVKVEDPDGTLPFRMVEQLQMAAHREFEDWMFVDGSTVGRAAWINGTLYISFSRR